MPVAEGAGHLGMRPWITSTMPSQAWAQQRAAAWRMRVFPERSISSKNKTLKLVAVPPFWGRGRGGFARSGVVCLYHIITKN